MPRLRFPFFQTDRTRDLQKISATNAAYITLECKITKFIFESLFDISILEYVNVMQQSLFV